MEIDDRRAVMVIKNGHNLREFYIKKITSLNTRKSLSLIGIIFFEFS